MIQYLTVDQVIEFHEAALSEFGGLAGVRSPHDLASAVMQPQQSAFGADAYSSIPEKAAAYGFFIAEAQAFLDGNKRTAAISMEVFLILNGYELHEADDEIAEMFEDVGSKTIGQGEFFGWVISHVRRTKVAEIPVKDSDRLE
jgi:death-on-curing protein